MCGPVALGITSAVLGIGQQYMAYQQAKSNIAFQNAQNNLNYQSQLLQTQSNRMTEDTREKMNQDFIAHTEFMADLAYERDSTRITMEQQQIQEQRAQEQTERGKVALQKKGEVASQRIGQNAWTLLAEIERSRAAADFVTNRNAAFALKGSQTQRLDAQADRASRRGAARTYLKKTYLDPVKPLRIPKPSFGPYALGMAGAVVGGFNTYYGVKANQAVIETNTPSDIRLKENIVRTGISPKGYPIYEFNYKNDPGTRYRGVMAHDLVTSKPDAISRINGYLAVDYSKLDVNFEVV
tara:strand:- start:571 stop:1458 length:888 start_codon:yes stop_codon:yes gene_type:complete